MLTLTNPEKTITLSSNEGEMKLEVFKRDLGVAVYAHLPESPLAIVEVANHTAQALAELAFHPEIQPWRSGIMTEAYRLPAY